MKPLFSRVAILGVGMVGGSLGKALLTRGIASEVAGYDPSPGVLEQALSLGAVTEPAVSLQEALTGSEVVFLAAPVMATLELLSQISPYLDENTIVTDVCSTKELIIQRASHVLPPSAAFVGGHPMAGSEKAGVEALDANLFENAIYVLSGQDYSALHKMQCFAEAVGAMPVIIAAQKHDLLVAAVSHLPHLAASALVDTIAGLEDREELLLLAASGFRDTTRIAMGSPAMWRDICLTNRAYILEMLDRLTGKLSEVRCMLSAGNADELYAHFEKAQEFRRMVPAHGKGILPHIFNLYVYVPDQPGIIGEIAGLVGGADINIAEIELLRVREEEGGPLRFGFINDAARLKAFGLLAVEGFRVELQEG